MARQAAAIAFTLLIARLAYCEDNASLPKDIPPVIAWQDFSSAKLKGLRARNKPVLVFCRADWDLTAAVLDRALFKDRRVIDAVKQLKYIPLRADFTHRSKEIEGFFRDVGGRPGEATIVVFHGPKDEAPIVLQMRNASQFISKKDLLDAMKPGGKAKKKSCAHTRPQTRPWNHRRKHERGTSSCDPSANTSNSTCFFLKRISHGVAWQGIPYRARQSG